METKRVSMENMVNEKSISLMLPIFNCIHTIDATIESILSQNFKEFTLHILDNKSTDGTFERCKVYANLEERIKLERNYRNIGWGLNFNKAIKNMNGKYGCIIHGDDIYGVNFLRDNIEIAKKYPNALIFTKGKTFKNNPPLKNSSSKMFSQVIAKEKQDFLQRLLEKGNTYFCPTAFMSVNHWQGLIRQFNFREFGGGCDLDAWLRASENLQIVEIKGSANFFYRLSSKQISYFDKTYNSKSVFVKVLEYHLSKSKKHLLAIHQLNHLASSKLSISDKFYFLLKIFRAKGNYWLKIKTLLKLII